MNIKGPKGRGAYSAIVYKDGDLYVAEDNVSTVIEENATASTVIQAALDHEVGVTLCLDGIYEIATSIAVPSNRTLKGESIKTIFEQPSPPLVSLIKNSDYSGGNTGIKIKNLTLDGMSRGVSYKHGIWLQNVTTFQIAEIYGLNFTGDGGNKYNNLIIAGNNSVSGRLVSYGSIHDITADTIEGDVVYVAGEDSSTNYAKYVNVYNIISKDCTYITVDFNEVWYSNINNVAARNPGNMCVNLDGCHHCNVNNIAAYRPYVGLCFGCHSIGTTGTCEFNTASNINCFKPTKNGIFFFNASKNEVSNFNIYGGSETGAALYIQATGAGTEDEGVASHNRCANGIIHMPNHEGVYINEATSSDEAGNGAFDNIYVEKTIGTVATGFKIDGAHTQFDICVAKGSKTAPGFDVRSGAGTCIFNGCEVHDGDGIGFQLGGGNCIVNGCIASLCDGSGFWSSIARNVFSNCIARGNGQDGAETYKDGFSFYGGINHHSIVSGCVSTGNAGYGVKGYSSPDYLLLVGNDLTGNTTSGTYAIGANSKADPNNNFW